VDIGYIRVFFREIAIRLRERFVCDFFAKLSLFIFRDSQSRTNRTIHIRIFDRYIFVIRL